MFRVDARVRIDLKSIVVVGRVFEKAVERIEHFVRQQEKELSEPSQHCVWEVHIKSSSP